VRAGVPCTGKAFERIGGAVGVEDQVPRAGLRQRAVGQRQQHPLGVEMGAGRVGDRPHQVLRTVHRLHQRPGYRVERRYDAFQTLCGDPEFGIEGALAGAHPGEPVQVRGADAAVVLGDGGHIAARNSARICASSAGRGLVDMQAS
jgi:hypothetical protein